MGKKGFIQISFTWLFAIIVGAIILFFAIYASVKLIGTEGSISSTETGKEIAVLLNPLETGFGETTTTPLTLPRESRINNNCETFGEFGEQEISISQQRGSEWEATGVSSVVNNKYLFSNERVEGKNFYLFSKPFEFPFKVADLIFLTSSKDVYCFADSPQDIKDELNGLNQGNLLTENCPSNSIDVCFSRENCEINVNINGREVEKKGDLVYFEGDALMYGAIFAEGEIYECQVKRLMGRVKELSIIYNDKENILLGKGCSAQVNPLVLADSASNLEDSSDLYLVNAVADDIEDENKRAECGLW